MYFEPFAPAALFLRILFAMALSTEKKQTEVDVYRIIVTGGLCLVVRCLIGVLAAVNTNPFYVSRALVIAYKPSAQACCCRAGCCYVAQKLCWASG